jgi:uncharacterized pyridoxamine 5'-phosphate oxidase family protein
MDLEDEKYEVEPIDFPYSITLPSQDFHKYCKDMFSATDKIEIMCTNNKVIFSGMGELGQIDFEVAETNGGLKQLSNVIIDHPMVFLVKLLLKVTHLQEVTTKNLRLHMHCIFSLIRAEFIENLLKSY